MVRDTRQGWAVLAAMTIIFVGLLAVCVVAEQNGQVFVKQGVDHTASALQAGGNMEGKEVPVRHRELRALGDGHDRGLERLGQRRCTTRSPHRRARADVADPARRGDLRRRGLRALRDAGVRDHRRLRGGAHGRPHAGVPRQEDRGLRDEDVVADDPHPAGGGAGRHGDRRRHRGRQSRPANPGAHGFSEILYGFSSAGNNNGSAFAGLSANTPFYNTALGIAMLFARYWLAVPALAIAGSLAGRRSSRPAPARCRPTRRCSSGCSSAW